MGEIPCAPCGCDRHVMHDHCTDNVCVCLSTWPAPASAPMAERRDYDAQRQAGREAVADLFGGDFNAADDLIGKLYRSGWELTPRAVDQHQGPYPFVLVRDEDTTGVSGTGIVAEGVEFTGPDGVGVVALRWLSDWPTSVVFHDRGIDSVVAVHGHGGKTRIEWR